MDRKTLFYIIEWGVALAACAYLAYRLVTYDNYNALWMSFAAMGWPRYVALLVCIALMPINMSLEAWRWKTLVPMTWREAHRQVYYSKLAGLITPWRLGEYPARALIMKEEQITNHKSSITNGDLWSRVLSMGAVGSATMTAAIVGAGTVALAFSPEVIALLGDSYLYALAAVILVLSIALYFAPKALQKWAEVNGALLATSLLQSLVRLLCWCVQLYLVLFALGAIINYPSSIINIPVYYLLVTVTPNVPIAEVGVRGAWAIALFGSMNAAFAGVLLWAINTLLPCMIWPFMRKNQN